ncbi:MAG: 1-deoxy-D-xylulose-5-phosphate synthase [Candidatus Riflebacteria bacterium]|nr:1-deoxy-D-xylulose-5-phosphate synthase [Candidatus Riflebacteria bacterium]
MRNAFARTIIDLAAMDPRIILLTADLGFMVLEPFAQRFPERFINAGVAEQNMVGVATGLAEAGFIPYVYSIANFSVLRPYEFIRNGPLYHRLPVRIIGVGDGFDYGSAGFTHHCLEDVGLLRMLPGMTVVVPSTPQETISALYQLKEVSGPVYFRLGKSVNALPEGTPFDSMHLTLFRPGRNALILAMGGIVVEALAAAEKLQALGFSCEVATVPSIQPPPLGQLIEALSRFSVCATVESHFVKGGLASLVSEIIAERGIKCRLIPFGVRTLDDVRSGSVAYLRKLHGLDCDSIVKRLHSSLTETRA